MAADNNPPDCLVFVQDRNRAWRDYPGQMLGISASRMLCAKSVSSTEEIHYAAIPTDAERLELCRKRGLLSSGELLEWAPIDPTWTEWPEDAWRSPSGFSVGFDGRQTACCYGPPPPAMKFTHYLRRAAIAAKQPAPVYELHNPDGLESPGDGYEFARKGWPLTGKEEGWCGHGWGRRVSYAPLDTLLSYRVPAGAYDAPEYRAAHPEMFAVAKRDWEKIAAERLLALNMYEARIAELEAQLAARPDRPHALTQQIGGGHYKDMAIQPVEYITRNGIPFIDGSIIKYISRHRAKNGRQDVEKARHFIDLLLALEYPEGGAE